MKVLKRSILSIFAICLFYLMFVDYIDHYEVSIRRNILSGETYIDTTGGFNLSVPWVLTSNIETRPIRICITSSSRIYNCKLVSFDPNGFEDFVELEGFKYYWWANRLSYNIGHDVEYRGISDIIKGYCFDESKKHSFIKIEKE